MFETLFPHTRKLDRGSLIDALRRSGRFCQPDDGDDGKGAGDGKGTDGGDGKAGGDKPAGGDDKGKGEGDGQPVPYARFAELVSERNAATREKNSLAKEVERLNSRIAELSSNDQSGTVTALQQQLKDLQKRIDQTDDYFSTLLEADLASLPDDAKAIVNDVPGGARDKYQFLAKHRARLAGTAAGNGGDGDRKNGKPGPTHDRKPEGSGDAGISSKTKSRIEAANSRVREGKGWTAPIPG